MSVLYLNGCRLCVSNIASLGVCFKKLHLIKVVAFCSIQCQNSRYFCSSVSKNIVAAAVRKIRIEYSDINHIIFIKIDQQRGSRFHRTRCTYRPKVYRVNSIVPWPYYLLPLPLLQLVEFVYHFVSPR